MPPRGGRGWQWPRGPWSLGGPLASGRPLALVTVKNFLIIFWRSPNFGRKNRWNFGEDLVFFIWRSHHNSDQTAAFFTSILDITKPEIRHIWAGPGPTFGSRRPCFARTVAEMCNHYTSASRSFDQILNVVVVVKTTLLTVWPHFQQYFSLFLA